MQREKIDFLVAVGEKLCNLDSSTEMQKLEGLTDASSNAKTESNHAWDAEDSPEEFLQMISQLVSDQDGCVVVCFCSMHVLQIAWPLAMRERKGRDMIIIPKNLIKVTFHVHAFVVLPEGPFYFRLPTICCQSQWVRSR